MSNAVTMTSEITVRPVQSMSGDAMVVAAARVSTSGEEAAALVNLPAEESTGLIRYLMRHRHGTPFEHSALTFFVHAPIFVFREWHRHRIGHSYNEESARYRPLKPVFWVPRRDRAMIPIDGWKPGRPKFLTVDQAIRVDWKNSGQGQHGTTTELTAEADEWYAREVDRDRRAYQLAYDLYQESLADGYALEVARCKLPVGIYSSCWVTVNLRSLMAFLSLRTHEPAANHVSYPQAEIEEAARACEQAFKAGWPVTHAAFCEFGREAP
ncbi:fad-dependent thymidylate synthase : Thymidylate synthase ThyX OS=Streptomyces sp. HGB0020 GN=thyX PE=3 SV=1: Thy1 [Gemmataceae bacterium]|nr:fad-dependent thymidylate synthase : Thymidylate synthase ThyX OS=Streptomyces sp. HGB0020 GN=thyX PE=3 SV=1: Thy1 [Gemmataceae bacterium]VTT96546.1 fad-dependent thymidylate synthase : Thymidylate synthase ThyX OS=Streptomyces sp. HGB0020 GN=thyX PE=3 SV=1: Thy1 [Gemmataceae bacterium]